MIKTESKAKLLAIESCQQISIYTGTFLPPPIKFISTNGETNSWIQTVW